MTDQLREKVRVSIQRLIDWCPPEGYYLAFSGGKDSVVVKRLMEMAGVPFDAHYHNTSVDPPELIRFIREQHPDVKIEFPVDKDGKRITMWTLIEKKMIPPTRLIRYCCEFLKESAGDGRMTVTGVRWAESSYRAKAQGIVSVWHDKDIKKATEKDENFSTNKQGGVILVNDNDESRSLVEGCYKRSKTLLNPIIDWTEDDIWEFIHEERVPYCGLYDEGWTRIGCIGCPMAGTKGREREFARWPKYKDLYLRAFARALERRKERNRPDDRWLDATPIDLFNWWMEYPVIVGQMSFDDVLEDDPEDDADSDPYAAYGGWHDA